MGRPNVKTLYKSCSVKACVTSDKEVFISYQKIFECGVTLYVFMLNLVIFD